MPYRRRNICDLDWSWALGEDEPVRATGFNHVSINALDLEESVDFYVSLFEMERIPTYDFSFPTQYLRLGELQLHIFERPTSAAPFHHIGINVDDFVATYQRARDLGILDHGAFGSPAYILPDGSVQCYLRDPAGNLVEFDWPDVTTLDTATSAEIPRLADHVPQTTRAEGATLYLSSYLPS